MVIKAWNLLNRRRRFTGSVMAILAIMLFSCRQQHKETVFLIKLLHQADVEESSNSVLHHLPPSLQLVGDSLVCMQLSATNFTVYNYFTGQIQQQLSVDTAVLPRLLAEVQAKINPKYLLMNGQESKEAAVPRTRIETIVYDDEQGKYFLFFDAFFYIDSPMVIKGKSEPFNWIMGIPFVTMLDAQLNGTNQYVLLDYGKSSPNFSYGGLLSADKLIVPNYDPQRAGAPGFGMLCSIDLAGTAYTMRNLDLPFDERTVKLQKMNRTEKVCFAASDTLSYYMASGNRIVYSKDNQFHETYRMDTSDHAYDLYVNQGRSQLYLHTLIWEDNKQKSTQIFSLDIQTKKLQKIYSGKEASVVKFINDSTLLKLTENTAEKHYEFELYKY
jgi:hypothetical protein